MIPKIVKMDVYPVAGHDSMELNLSGAHAPYFTRNIVVLEDSSGNLGVGEVPGGQKITKAMEDVKHLVIDTRIADYKATLNRVREWLNANIKDDVRGLQTFDLRRKPGLGIEADLEQIKKANKIYMENCLGARDDAKGMQYLIPGWKFDNKKPCLVR